MAKKKVVVPVDRVAREDPEVIEVETVPTGKTEVIDVDTTSTAPLQVLEFAHSVKEEPWTWFIAPTYVSIVARSGKKYRFSLGGLKSP